MEPPYALSRIEYASTNVENRIPRKTRRFISQMLAEYDRITHSYSSRGHDTHSFLLDAPENCR